MYSGSRHLRVWAPASESICVCVSSRVVGLLVLSLVCKRDERVSLREREIEREREERESICVSTRACSVYHLVLRNFDDLCGAVQGLAPISRSDTMVTLKSKVEPASGVRVEACRALGG